MRTIHKFILHLESSQPVEVPKDAIIRVVGTQFDHNQGRDAPVLWIEVDTEAPKEWRTFCIRGTGNDIAGAGTYVGTAFCGPFVWHVFESPYV